MGMCCLMGSHFYNCLDHDWAAFSGIFNRVSNMSGGEEGSGVGGGGARTRLGTSQPRGLMLTLLLIYREGIMLYKFKYTNSLQIP